MSDVEKFQQEKMDGQRRINAAAQAIQAILEEYSCTLVATPYITKDGRIVAGLRLESK